MKDPDPGGKQSRYKPGSWSSEDLDLIVDSDPIEAWYDSDLNTDPHYKVPMRIRNNDDLDENKLVEIDSFRPNVYSLKISDTGADGVQVGHGNGKNRPNCRRSRLKILILYVID